MARLSTHVLDTARGVPASDMTIELHRLENGGRQLVATVTTDADGRTPGPLLSGDRLAVGIYELSFHVGAYFRAAGMALAEPPFLDVVVVRVGLADASGSYHVPLLVAPFGYSTYRGT
jgi:5-hydroxyisourate hydrolase